MIFFHDALKNYFLPTNANTLEEKRVDEKGKFYFSARSFPELNETKPDTSDTWIYWRNGKEYRLDKDPRGDSDKEVHRWYVNGRRIDLLLRKGKYLAYQLYDVSKTEKRDWIFPIPQDESHPTEEKIKYLSESFPEPVRLDNDSPLAFDFTKNITPISKTWISYGGSKASLRLVDIQQGIRMWQLHDEQNHISAFSTMKNSMRPQKAIFPYYEYPKDSFERTSGKAKYFFAEENEFSNNNYGTWRYEHRMYGTRENWPKLIRDQSHVFLETFLEHFKVSSCKMDDKGLKVSMIPYQAKSDIDDRVFVGKATWAVTLLVYKGKCGNHAELAVEGINDKDHHFRYIVDLKGPDNIGIWELTERDKILFEGRSEIWKVPAYKVYNMITEINQEKQSHPKFNRYGSDSIFNKKGYHNCFTWAREKLEMLDIYLEKKPSDNIFALVKRHTKPKNEFQLDYYTDFLHNKLTESCKDMYLI